MLTGLETVGSDPHHKWAAGTNLPSRELVFAGRYFHPHQYNSGREYLQHGLPPIASLAAFFSGVIHAIGAACCGACDAFMDEDELFRNIPANIHELRLAMAGLPQDMKVLAESETGVSEGTVEELFARTTWPPDLVVTAPRKLHPKSVVKISKAA